MHETSQQQRVNNFMSIDSSKLGSSKFNMKKNPFYKHDDPLKLNYFARFSPKRKTLNDEFEQIILEGASPLSPRTSRVSFSSKKSFESVARKIFKDQSHQRQNNRIEIVDPNILLFTNETQRNRGEIFIDEDEELSEDEMNNNDFQHNANDLISNNIQQNGFYHKKNFLEISIQQNPLQWSESHQSSSFERMIEPSSSEDNDVPFISVSKASGGQMLIEDDDFEPQLQETSKKFKVQGSMKIIEGSEQKILELAKSIGAYNQHQTIQQGKAQNISFSIDSDLSFMEQNWSSYFQAGHDDQQVSQRQILSENLISQDNNNQKFLKQNARKISSSSEEQLPSFSHPDTSSYHITPFQSQRSSTYSQNTYHMADFETETEAKQFKRQFTFGNELNAGFEENESQIQSKPVSKQPLFKKFLQKSVINNFKQKNFNKKQKDKNLTCKSKTFSIVSEKLSTSQKNKVKKPLTSNEKKIINSNLIIPLISVQKTEEKKQDQEPHLEQEFHQSQSKKRDEILIVEEQSDEENNADDISSEAIKMIHQPREKQHEQIQNRVKWQNTLRPIIETQKLRQNSSIKQKQQEVKQNLINEIKIDECDEIEQKNCPTEYRRVSFDKAEKFIEQNSYLKIFSEKKFHRVRKGSYNDRVKISQNQYQSSEEEENSQNGNKYSQQKSQRCESITTATQEVNQNSQVSAHYFLKNKQNCISQVENLKKYLQKIQNSPLKEKEKTTDKEGTFDFHENFEVYGSQKDGISESPQSSFFQRSQCQNENKKQNLKRSEKNCNDDSSISQISLVSDPIFPESYRPNSPMKFHSDETPIKMLKKESEFEQELLNFGKKQQMNISLTQIKHQGFEKSLTILEELIQTGPLQLGRVYEKIYTQVYQQEVKYQQKLEKQESLISFMQNCILGQTQKIDCEKFLSQYLQKKEVKNKDKISIACQDHNRFEIWINKHIILSLVRKIAQRYSKQPQQQ